MECLVNSRLVSVLCDNQRVQMETVSHPPSLTRVLLNFMALTDHSGMLVVFSREPGPVLINSRTAMLEDSVGKRYFSCKEKL